MTWQTDAKKILATLLGITISGAGGFFLFLEMRSPPAHSGHVYLFSGFIAVGMFIVAPAVIGSALGKVLSYLPSVTLSGGKDAKPKDSE